MQSISRNVRLEYRTASGGFIDCLIPDAGVIVEQKGLGIDLDKPEERQGRMVTPFEQALTYAESFPRNRQPRFVVVCNFSTFRVHDRDACPRAELAGKYVEFTLEELGRNPHLLDFVTDPANSRSERKKQVSMEAGRLIGELHALLQAQCIDPESEESQKALNILCVRLVFCLFCEDAELFPKDALLNYLRNVEPKNMRVALKRLFKALDTPIEKRAPYDKSVKPFPYVNGAFRGGIRDPQLHRRDKVQAAVRGVPADRLVTNQPHHLRRNIRVNPEPGDPPLGRYALHQVSARPTAASTSSTRLSGRPSSVVRTRRFSRAVRLG